MASISALCHECARLTGNLMTVTPLARLSVCVVLLLLLLVTRCAAESCNTSRSNVAAMLASMPRRSVARGLRVHISLSWVVEPLHLECHARIRMIVQNTSIS